MTPDAALEFANSLTRRQVAHAFAQAIQESTSVTWQELTELIENWATDETIDEDLLFDCFRDLLADCVLFLQEPWR